ncbi:transposase [Zunongwangia sp. F297]|uniref:Transposase n=1 Tax=Autumnicola edwardsiae TaxID=3075594 RepID=A0ABU3CW85_9FLAO|nr:transposase [Zunongwangia sp. F297]MDT0650627.1 transposase [Zunongwangia sp. F297]
MAQFFVEHFDLVKSNKEKEEVLHLYFEEWNIPLQEHSSGILTSKGFPKEVTIQDFPFRDKTVYLHVIRRRWIDKHTSKVV